MSDVIYPIGSSEEKLDRALRKAETMERIAIRLKKSRVELSRDTLRELHEAGRELLRLKSSQQQSPEAASPPPAGASAAC